MFSRVNILGAGLVLCIGTLAACAGSPRSAETTPAPVGGDRDAHGCISSAGHTWCARDAACVRPWELAQKIGFANTAEEFRTYCSGPAK
jgi:hypothetical protein